MSVIDCALHFPIATHNRGLVATSEGGWELKEVCEGYRVKVVLSHDLLVTSGSCTCCKSKQSAPGNVPCKHVAALLYSAVEPPLPPAANGATADNSGANVCFIVLWDADMTDCSVKAGGVRNNFLPHHSAMLSQQL
jgi:SWIM zinc finger